MLITKFFISSDNGREFDNHLIKALVNDWQGCTLIHGKPRHSQSQGSVERANQDLENMLCAWMRDYESTNWSRALLDVQFAKNRALNKGIGRSPYQAVFGSKPRAVPNLVRSESSAGRSAEPDSGPEEDSEEHIENVPGSPEMQDYVTNGVADDAPVFEVSNLLRNIIYSRRAISFLLRSISHSSYGDSYLPTSHSIKGFLHWISLDCITFFNAVVLFFFILGLATNGAY